MAEWIKVGFPSRSEIEDYTCLELTRKLQSYLDCPFDSLCELITQNVDGYVFLRLSGAVLFQMGSFSVGHTVKLQSLLHFYESDGMTEAAIPTQVSVKKLSRNSKIVHIPALNQSSVVPSAIPPVFLEKKNCTDLSNGDPGVSYERIFRKRPSRIEKSLHQFYGKKYLACYHRSQNLIHNRNIRKVRSWFQDAEGRLLLKQKFDTCRQRKDAIHDYIRRREPELENLQFMVEGGVKTFRWKPEDIYSHWFVNYHKHNVTVKREITEVASESRSLKDGKQDMTVKIEPSREVSLSGGSSTGNTLTCHVTTSSGCQADFSDAAEFLQLSQSQKLLLTLIAVSDRRGKDDFIVREQQLRKENNETNLKVKKARAFAYGELIMQVKTKPYESWIVRVTKLLQSDKELANMFIPLSEENQKAHLQVKFIKEGQLLDFPRVYISVQTLVDASQTSPSPVQTLVDASQTSPSPMLVHKQSLVIPTGESPLSVPVRRPFLHISSTLPVQASRSPLPVHNSSLAILAVESPLSMLKSSLLIPTAESKEKFSCYSTLVPEEFEEQLHNTQLEEYTRNSKDTEASLSNTGKSFDEQGLFIELNEASHCGTSQQERSSQSALRSFLGPRPKKLKCMKQILRSTEEEEPVSPSTEGEKQKSEFVNKTHTRERELERPNPQLLSGMNLSEQAKLTIAMVIMGEKKISNVYGKLFKFIADQNRDAEKQKSVKPFTGHRSDDKITLLDKVVQWALTTKLRIVGDVQIRNREMIISTANVEFIA